MDKLQMKSTDLTQQNYEKLAALFPNAVTETVKGYDEQGNAIIERAIDADVLRQEISAQVVEGRQQRYQFTWPDKNKAIVLGNTPTTKTLRLDREKSVGRDGTKGSIDTENIYIEGDNLDALKILRDTYLGKVKMIYIDPPYNTGNDFIYEDDFSESGEAFADRSGLRDEDGNLRYDMKQNNEASGRFHTDWLNMMYPRLRLARDLLSDDGVIFISIDDHEVSHLRIMCDHIFGEDNNIATLIWQQRKGGGNDSRFVAVDHEYILIYCRNVGSCWMKWRVPQSEEYLKRYKEQECDGRRYYWDTLIRNGLQSPIIVKLKTPDGDTVVINSQWSQKRVEDGLKDGTVRFSKTSNGWSLHHKVYMGEGQVIRSLLTEYGNNRSAGQNLMALFGSALFDYSKPHTLIKVLVQLCTGKGDFVLDFFSGSATTAHAVMQLNAEDGGHRKFIMVQLPERCEEKSEAYKAGYKTICEIGEERIRRAGKKIKDESPITTQDLDVGFRVFRVDDSNMKDVYYRPDDLGQIDIEDMIDNIKPDRTPEDLLFQTMLSLGVFPSSKIEEITVAGKKVFDVADGFLVACFDSDVNDIVVTEIAKRKPSYAVFRDSGFADDAVSVNFDQIFREYSPNTERKVL